MKITIFGDSITNGYGMDEGGSSNILQRLIEARRPDIKVALHGINGDDTYGGLLRVKYVLAENADINFIFFGANDASPQHLIRADEYQANLNQMIDELGGKKCVLITAPYYNEKEPMHYSSLAEVKIFREAAVELAAKRQVPLIDIFRVMMAQENPDALLRPDGLHFTEAAYELLADEIIKKIEEIK
ncbi:SGNH/GDSL hydrolase family protein [Lactovum odontotermitis]